MVCSLFRKKSSIETNKKNRSQNDSTCWDFIFHSVMVEVSSEEVNMMTIVSSRVSLYDDDDSRGAWGQVNMMMAVISRGASKDDDDNDDDSEEHGGK